MSRAVASIEAAGASLTLVGIGAEPLRFGEHAERARVVFHTDAARRAFDVLDPLGLAEAYLQGDVDIEGDVSEVLRVATELPLAASWRERASLSLRLLLRDRLRYDRESIAFHYDRPVEFFLPWLGRWRCYSHGLYQREDEPLDDTMARKMQAAIDALGLEPGMEVLDMGGGWGCFLEYAGLQGIRVRAITISPEQQGFCQRLIDERQLPCTIELVNFREYSPERPLDGAVFMGTFEHNPEYERAAAFLARHLAPHGRVWADFCAQRTDFTIGAFMKRYVWPGPITYVNPYGLVTALVRAGFNVHELRDDTLSYAYTIRDWGDRFEADRKSLAEQFGEPAVRAFLLFLRGSWHFLRENRTQAYHLVAGRDPAALSPR